MLVVKCVCLDCDKLLQGPLCAGVQGSSLMASIGPLSFTTLHRSLCLSVYCCSVTLQEHKHDLVIALLFSNLYLSVLCPIRIS